MAKVLVTETHLEDIADSIRAKNGTGNAYKPSEMSGAIDALVVAQLGTKSITANGTYNASDDSVNGYSQVTVNVPSDTLVSKTITANGTYDPADDSADGYSSVTVNVSSSSGTPIVYPSATQSFNYINTGITCNDSSLMVELSVRFGQWDASGDAAYGLLGGAWSASGFLLIEYGDVLRWHSGSAYIDIPAEDHGLKDGDASVLHTIVCEYDSITIDGTQYTLTPTATNTSNKLKLFTCSSTTNQYAAVVALEECKIYIDNQLVRDITPSSVSSSSYSCFAIYDSVTDASLTSSGTFLYGMM